MNEDDYSLCEYCDTELYEHDAKHTRERVGTNCATGEKTTTVYTFCTGECADNWEASR